MRPLCTKTQYLVVAITLLAFVAIAFGLRSASAQRGGGQASLTLTNCAASICYTNDTAWDLSKTNDGPGDGIVTWTVTATKVTTTHDFVTAKGSLTITNTGTANATIGNIVVNMQKKIGSNWVSASAVVADATSGDGATTAK